MEKRALRFQRFKERLKFTIEECISHNLENLDDTGRKCISSFSTLIALPTPTRACAKKTAQERIRYVWTNCDSPFYACVCLAAKSQTNLGEMKVEYFSSTIVDIFHKISVPMTLARTLYQTLPKDGRQPLPRPSSTCSAPKSTVVACNLLHAVAQSPDTTVTLLPTNLADDDETILQITQSIKEYIITIKLPTQFLLDLAHHLGDTDLNLFCQHLPSNGFFEYVSKNTSRTVIFEFERQWPKPPKAIFMVNSSTGERPADVELEVSPSLFTCLAVAV